MGRIVGCACLIGMMLASASVATALDADDLSELLGYTMVASTHVEDEFEGAELGKTVQLDNGMVFEFMGYHYTYAYRPAVAVFSQKVTAEALTRAGVKDAPPGGTTFYKLVIRDHIYNARRLR